MSNICMHFHPSVYTWWCGRLFFSSLHTTILHMFARLIDHLTHHHSSQFSSCGWWCRKLSSSSTSSSSYTPPSTRVIPSHSSTFIIIFMPLSGVPSYTQSYQHLLVSGVRFTEHQPSLVFWNILILILHSPEDLSAISRIGFITSYYIYITLLVCICH